MKKIKYQIITIIICVLVALAAIYIFEQKKTNNNAVLVPMAVTQLPDIQKTLKKIQIEDTILTEIKQKQELITMEVELQQEMIWNDSWGTFSIFKKEQLVRFHGTGLYTTDLSQIKQEEVIFDHDEKRITIKTPKPTIKAISIDESKTEYQATQTGWLRFGNIKITPADSQIMNMQVEELMKEEMNKKELYEKAEEYTKTSTAEIFNKLLTAGGNDDYKVNIELK